MWCCIKYGRTSRTALGIYINIDCASCFVKAEKVNLLQSKKTTRDKVVELFRILPRRGATAFSTFRAVIQKDYKWLADKLTVEYAQAYAQTIHIKDELLTFTKKMVVPLVDSNLSIEGPGPYQLVLKTLHELIHKLISNCCKEIGIPTPAKYLPIHILIRARVHKLQERVRQFERHIDDVTQADADEKQIKALTKKNKRLADEVTKLEHLKTKHLGTINSKCSLLRRIEQELKEVKQDRDTLVKAQINLKVENEILKNQL